LQCPPNYQLVADELARLCNFKRARATVKSYVKTHLSHLVPTPPPKKRTYRRFRRAYVGELWQHDSSIHQWWPAPRKQTLLLTVDDCSGLYVAGRFVESDTTWNHFQHFREAFEHHGLPEAIYTDALSLFGPSSSNPSRRSAQRVPACLAGASRRASGGSNASSQGQDRAQLPNLSEPPHRIQRPGLIKLSRPAHHSGAEITLRTNYPSQLFLWHESRVQCKSTQNLECSGERMLENFG
jgi:hypothetical protein